MSLPDAPQNGFPAHPGAQPPGQVHQPAPALPNHQVVAAAKKHRLLPLAWQYVSRRYPGTPISSVPLENMKTMLLQKPVAELKNAVLQKYVYPLTIQTGGAPQ